MNMTKIQINKGTCHSPMSGAKLWIATVREYSVVFNISIPAGPDVTRI